MTSRIKRPASPDDFDFAVPTSVSIGKHWREFIRQQISEGRYTTGSEVLRAGLRLLEEEDLRRRHAADSAAIKQTQGATPPGE